MEEDESPYAKVAFGLRERGIATGRIGIEETVKFVFADGIAKAAPQSKIVQRDACYRRLPLNQECCGDRADAAGLQHHARGLQGGALATA